MHASNFAANQLIQEHTINSYLELNFKASRKQIRTRTHVTPPNVTTYLHT